MSEEGAGENSIQPDLISFRTGVTTMADAGSSGYRNFPQFRATFTAAYRMCALGVATPNIGDSGSTGSVDRVSVSPHFIADGYRYTRDPAMAVAASSSRGFVSSASS